MLQLRGQASQSKMFPEFVGQNLIFLERQTSATAASVRDGHSWGVNLPPLGWHVQVNLPKTWVTCDKMNLPHMLARVKNFSCRIAKKINLPVFWMGCVKMNLSFCVSQPACVKISHSVLASMRYDEFVNQYWQACVKISHYVSASMR
jgi:hypothetical protein